MNSREHKQTPSPRIIQLHTDTFQEKMEIKVSYLYSIDEGLNTQLTQQ